MSSIVKKWGRDFMEGALTAPSFNEVLKRWERTNEGLPIYAPMVCMEKFQRISGRVTAKTFSMANGAILIGAVFWIHRYLVQRYGNNNDDAGVNDIVVESYDDELLSPAQLAAKDLQHFIKFNQSSLQGFPCKIIDPIRLGDDKDKVGLKGLYLLKMPEGATFYDLANTGVHDTNASVQVLHRLKEELSIMESNELSEVYGIECIFKDGEDKDKDDEPEHYKAGAEPFPHGELVKANAFLSIHRDIIRKNNFLSGRF